MVTMLLQALTTRNWTTVLPSCRILNQTNMELAWRSRVALPCGCLHWFVFSESSHVMQYAELTASCRCFAQRLRLASRPRA